MISEYKKLIYNKSFIGIWVSQITSQLAIHIMNFLLIIHLFEKTNSSIAVSLLWIASALPAILIGPIAAATTDMIDRKNVLVATNLMQSIVILLFVIAHPENLYLYYVLVFLYSIINQFYVPSESAAIPSVVNKSSLANANSMFFISLQSSMIVGFAIAGVLDQFLGFRYSLLLCSALLFSAFISVLSLPRLKVKLKIPNSFERAFRKFFDRILEGYSYIKGDKNVLIPLGLLMVFQTILVVVVVSLPAITTDILKLPVKYSGIFVVVPAGIGALLGSLLVPPLLKKGMRKKNLIEKSILALFLTDFVLISASYVNMFLTRISLVVTVLIFMGFAYVGILIPSLTFLQEKTEGGLRGRVFGNFWFLSTILTVIPVIFSGTLTDLFGIRIMLVVLGFVILAIYYYSKKFEMKLLKKSDKIDA